jgi:cation diffusion facilitator family transporter
MNKTFTEISMQKFLVAVSCFLFVLKIIAWYYTESIAILTDALESIVNIVAGCIGLYSIILSAKPKDKNHPYGHGKIEFISSAIEGILICIAGVFILIHSFHNLLTPHALQKLDLGIVLLTITACINWFLGRLSIQKGKESNSPILHAGGTHLLTDTYSTLGLLVGIALIYFTKYYWIDVVIAMLFAMMIIYSGYKIIRKSIAGIMDESDTFIIDEICQVLQNNRHTNWVDIHNMRVINYAGFYHIDCHLTIPFYNNIHDGHKIVDTLTDVLTQHFKHRVEFFIHVDGCLPFQCSICNVFPCAYRNIAFIKQLIWNQDLILSNEKHQLIKKAT